MVTGADLQVVEARGVVAISRALSLRHTRDVKAQGVSADAKPHRPPHRIPRSYMHVAVPHVPRKAQSSVAYRAAIGLLVCYFAFMTQMQMQAQAARLLAPYWRSLSYSRIRRSFFLALLVSVFPDTNEVRHPLML